MTLLNILIAPHPLLKEVAAPVKAVTPEVLELLDDMLETMYHAEGIGLAATQVGVLQRLLVVDLDYYKEDANPAPLKLINPEITWQSDEMYSCNEGCLSLPDIFEERERPAKIKYTALNVEGAAYEAEAEGLLAFCIQHEIDHLNGVLFTDYLSRLKRERALKKLDKLKKQQRLPAYAGGTEA